MIVQLKNSIASLLNQKRKRKRRMPLHQAFECICPACQHTIKNQSHVPCCQFRCPKCSTFMARRFN